MIAELIYHCNEFVAKFIMRNRDGSEFTFTTYIEKDWYKTKKDRIYAFIDEDFSSEIVQTGSMIRFSNGNTNGGSASSFYFSDCESAFITVDQANECYQKPCTNILLYGSKLIDCFPIYDNNKPRENQCSCGAFRYNERIFALKERFDPSIKYDYTFILIDGKVNMKGIKIKGKVVFLYNVDYNTTNYDKMKENNKNAFKDSLSFDVSIKGNKVNHVLDCL
jgi:hypothetical protein